MAVYLAQQLTAAGFTVKQVVREYSQIESDALAGKFDAFILSRATVLDSGDPVAYLYSDFACEDLSIFPSFAVRKSTAPCNRRRPSRPAISGARRLCGRRI